jgi:nucleoredoxin
LTTPTKLSIFHSAPRAMNMSLHRLHLYCLLFVATVATASARTWTNQNGNTIEADFVGLNGETLVLKGKDGKNQEIPLASLTDADQSFAKEQATGAAATSAEPPSVFKGVIEGKLVAVDGKRVSKFEMAAEPQYYAFYFSASWCAPCKAFTPQLISFYNGNPGAKKTFEVIFLSRDETGGAMEKYMKGEKMPWPAVRFRDARRIDEITRYEGEGIPYLVVVDRQGKVIADSFANGEYIGPASALAKMGELAPSTAAR